MQEMDLEGHVTSQCLVGKQQIINYVSHEQRLFEVKPFCQCFDFVSHRNGGSTNLHQVLCEKRIQGCRNFLNVAKSLRECRHCCIDPELLKRASEWRFKNEPRPEKARKAPSKVKVMLTVFFDYQGIVHHKFQQQGSTITADSYLGVLRRLREAIRQKRPVLWARKSWILHHDNAPVHTALKISKFRQDHSTSVFPQPPYSPDLAPCDFFLFGKLKKKS
ncbi:CLCN3 [Cordylochernes scorpioides]|uniref:CLCN3 n=1 Tax=Cordylochernes scorpioides TaxID=51811 RepID=A0ABY6L758_9ARAC|nr:CLCN3 [Cordylochernes scorpioides]